MTGKFNFSSGRKVVFLLAGMTLFCFSGFSQKGAAKVDSGKSNAKSSSSPNSGKNAAKSEDSGSSRTVSYSTPEPVEFNTPVPSGNTGRNSVETPAYVTPPSYSEPAEDIYMAQPSNEVVIIEDRNRPEIEENPVPQPVKPGKSGKPNKPGKPVKEPVKREETGELPAPPSSQQAIKNIENAVAEIRGLLNAPNWTDTKYQTLYHNNLQVIQTNLAYVDTDERLETYEQWYDLYEVTWTQRMEWYVVYADFMNYLEQKSRLLQFVFPDIYLPEGQGKLDTLLNYQEGGWKFYEFVNSWNPREVREVMREAEDFENTIAMETAWTRLDLFFAYFKTSNFGKTLKWKTQKEMAASVEVSTTDPELSALLMENAWFLVSAYLEVDPSDVEMQQIASDLLNWNPELESLLEMAEYKDLGLLLKPIYPVLYPAPLIDEGVFQFPIRNPHEYKRR